MTDEPTTPDAAAEAPATGTIDESLLPRADSPLPGFLAGAPTPAEDARRADPAADPADAAPPAFLVDAARPAPRTWPTVPPDEPAAAGQVAPLPPTEADDLAGLVAPRASADGPAPPEAPPPPDAPPPSDAPSSAGAPTAADEVPAAAEPTAADEPLPAAADVPLAADVAPAAPPLPDAAAAAAAADARRRAAAEENRLVAHILLRSGAVLPARVHLETLAGRDALGRSGLLDLAESRWRTGDLAGAGEAAAAYLEAGGEAPLGSLIAAETMSAQGRPGEARKLARRALEEITLPLDAVFAGQRRSAIWPHDPDVPAEPAGTLFAPLAPDASHGGRIGLTAAAATTPVVASATATAGPATAAAPVPAADAGVPPTPSAPDAAVRAGSPAAPAPGLWDQPADAAALDPVRELEGARRALDAGDQRDAAVRLAIVLRMRPALAPAVLDLVGQLPGADFDLLRGDALRLVGHEAAAERAFASAARALASAPPTTKEP